MAKRSRDSEGYIDLSKVPKGHKDTLKSLGYSEQLLFTLKKDKLKLIRSFHKNFWYSFGEYSTFSLNLRYEIIEFVYTKNRLKIGRELVKAGVFKSEISFSNWEGKALATRNLVGVKSFWTVVAIAKHLEETRGFKSKAMKPFKIDLKRRTVCRN